VRESTAAGEFSGYFNLSPRCVHPNRRATRCSDVISPLQRSPNCSSTVLALSIDERTYQRHVRFSEKIGAMHDRPARIERRSTETASPSWIFTVLPVRERECRGLSGFALPDRTLALGTCHRQLCSKSKHASHTDDGAFSSKRKA